MSVTNGGEARNPAACEAGRPVGGEVFRSVYKLRFGQCDPAGIAFFPRLVEMVNWTVEDWFDSLRGATFRQIHIDRKEGVPAVSINVDFVGPAELGDRIRFDLRVEAVGRSSITLRIAAERGDGDAVLKAVHTIVYCDLSGAKPKAMPIPDDLRLQIVRYVTGE